MVDFTGFGLYTYVIPGGQLHINVMEGTTALVINIGYDPMDNRRDSYVSYGSIAIPYDRVKSEKTLTRTRYRRIQDER